MASALPEIRTVYLAGLVSASAAATGYGQTDYPGNSILLLSIAGTASQTVTVALSSGTATGAAGSAVTIGGATSVTASASAKSTYAWRLPDKLSKYTYASISADGGNVSGTVALVNTDYVNSNEGATAQRPTEG